MPRFSIVIPCFNAARTLPETLASLAGQSVTDWEAICVNDGSTDATAEIVARAAAADPRIHLVRNPRKGPSAARNHGALVAAQGEIVAFCDADDLFATGRLARLDEAFAERKLDAAFGKVAFFVADPGEAGAISTVPAGLVDVPMLLGENPVCTMSNLTIRRKAFAETGGFDERLVHNEDLEWLIRLVGFGARLRGIDTVLTHYRTNPSGLSSDLAAMQAGRDVALATARRFGFRADARAEAVHLRYLARRALRLDQPGFAALRLAAAGLAASPAGFLSDPRRGGLTLAGALTAPLLPRRLRRALFCH